MNSGVEMKLQPEKIETYIENAFAEWKIPGGAVAIIDGDKVVSSRGYGVRKVGGDALIDEETLFPIGSCTKAFTAAVLAMLVDEGKLDWDDRIIRFLPDFKMYDPEVTAQVTIRDMLCHRTGTMRSIRVMNRDRVFDSDDYIRRMAYLRPIADFRSRFGYNNPHFIVAGKVAEVVTGRKWKDLVQQYIFDRLGMNASAATFQDMMRSGTDNIASPHANLDGGFVPAELRVLDPVQSIGWTDYGENAAGSILSNLKDMTTWLQLLLQDGRFNGEEMLSHDVMAEMTSAQIAIRPGESDMDAIFAVGLEVDKLSYGLGWYVMDYRGYKMVLHPGQLNGFVSAVAFLPELKLGGVILMNTYNTMLHAMLGYYIFDAMLGYDRDYSGDMQALVRQWRAGAEAEIGGMLASRLVEATPAFSVEQLIGRYASALFGEVVISLENGMLVYRYGETELFTADLELWQGDTYIINYRNKINPPEFLTFIPDEKGKIISLSVKDVDIFQRV